MTEIIIIEDDDSDYKRLLECIENFGRESGEQLNVKRYVSALQFLDGYKSDADIIFMDIGLPDINGVQASEKLRVIDENVALVFVTNLAHLAIKGYSVSATDFIVKPINYFKLKTLLKKLIKKSKILKDDSISITSAHSVERVPLSEIMYVEAVAHRITVHLPEREIVFSGTLSAIEKLLPPDRFVRCYQSYIVNLKFVTGYDLNDVKLSNGIMIPLSRSRKKEVTQKLSELFFKREK